MKLLKFLPLLLFLLFVSFAFAACSPKQDHYKPTMKIGRTS